MKNVIIAGIAAIAAVASFSSTASADTVIKYKNGWHRPHATVVVRPRARVYVAPRRVYVAPRVVIRDDCYTKKVRRVNNNGNVVIKRVRVCR